MKLETPTFNITTDSKGNLTIVDNRTGIEILCSVDQSNDNTLLVKFPNSNLIGYCDNPNSVELERKI